MPRLSDAVRYVPDRSSFKRSSARVAAMSNKRSLEAMDAAPFCNCNSTIRGDKAMASLQAGLASNSVPDAPLCQQIMPQRTESSSGLRNESQSPRATTGPREEALAVAGGSPQ